MSRRVPYIFAAAHAVFATVVFGAAIFNPLRAGLLPLAIHYLDFPASLVIERVAYPLGQALGAPLLAFYGMYLVFGSLWFFLLGLIVAKLA
jgi:hypothetical protein